MEHINLYGGNMKKSEPIRVAHIMGKLCAGGVESVVFNYYKEIDKELIQFDFYYDSDSSVDPPLELTKMGARFIKIPPYQHIFSYLYVLKKYFKINDYKVIHSHINTLSVFPLFVAFISNIPIRIVHNHSVPSGKEYFRNALKYFLRFFSKVFATDYFACSEKAGKWMFGEKSLSDGKVFIMKNAVNFDKYNCSIRDTQKNDLRYKYDLGNRFIVTHVGRLTFAKNHKFLLKVFMEILKQKDAYLFIVGGGELENDIKREIEKLGLSEFVKITGSVFNVEDYYCVSDVVIMPSIFEGLSLVTIESQISGVPIVVSEAIPDEAIISDSVCKLSLEELPSFWGEKAIEISKKNVVLNEKSVEYDIKKQVSRLESWYYNEISNI